MRKLAGPARTWAHMGFGIASDVRIHPHLESVIALKTSYMRERYYVVRYDAALWVAMILVSKAGGTFTAV